MKKTLTIATIILLVFGQEFTFAQEQKSLQRALRGKEAVSPDEVVSLKSDLPFSQAVQSLSELSKKFLKKPIFDPNPRDTPIGVNIQAMYWRDALEIILRSNGLWYQEYADYFQIGSPQAISQAQQQQSGPVSPVSGVPFTPQTTPSAMQGVGPASQIDSSEILAKSREVTISAIFLEIDKRRLQESGVSFSILRQKDYTLGIEFLGAEKVTSPIFGVAGQAGQSLTNPVSIATALQFFESEAIGEVLARPQITVRSGQRGYVQIGQDFSIRSRDFSGNVVESFQSTGTIMTVTPTVYQFGGKEFVDITLVVERSGVIPGEVSTIINKTKAESRLLLLDKEEAYVGGLYEEREDKRREGVPILKDLPWWVFGLRYIFGYDANTTTRKELIVLLKAELLPLVEDRLTQQPGKLRNILQEKLDEGRKDTEKRLKKGNQ
jgi:hypothetical protein